jgi:hypothetical protein
MNYLAHGYRFLDDPNFLAGTAVPDWLCVSDRGTRVRSRRIEAAQDGMTFEQKRIVSGISQHLADDDTFHRLPLFATLETDLSARFRAGMPDRFDHRPGFLGHIVTELMLDAFLAENNPTLLQQYYRAMSAVDTTAVQVTVNLVAARPATHLAKLIQKFNSLQFLYDYLDDAKLLARLNQVLKRVTLPPLDDSFQSVLSDARRLLRIHGDSLLKGVVSDATT